MKYISSESYKINDKLRRGTALSKGDRQFVEALDQALRKLPEYRGTVYRSLAMGLEIEDADAFVAEYVVGKGKQFPSYISSSLGVYDPDMPIQYIITSRHGKDMTMFNAGEREVLFPRDTWFHVTKVSGHTIYMEEIEDD